MTLQLKLKVDPDPELISISKIRPPVRLKHFLIKRYHRKRLYELSLKTIGQVPQLEDPNDEQLQWIERKMKAPASSWRSCK